MLHEIGTQLAAALQSRGLGIPVVDGPERRPTTTGARERVVIQHDDGDSFGPKHRADRMPQTRMTRVMACKILIYARDPNPGAAEWEHRRRCEQMLDMVLIQLDVIAKDRQNMWHAKSGRFLLAEDLAKSETPSGVVYELTFDFDRGVRDLKWNLEAPAETVTITNDPTGVTIVNNGTVTGSTQDGGTSTETIP